MLLISENCSVLSFLKLIDKKISSAGPVWALLGLTEDVSAID